MKLQQLFIVGLTVLLTICNLHTHEQLPEKRIIVLMCSYNNGPKVHQALASVVLQRYTNWHAYFFDDASQTNDAAHAKAFLDVYDTHHNVTVIRNQENQGALANHLHGGPYNNEVHNDDILVFVDADDFLVHQDVFKRVNEEYHKGAVATFGQYIQLPSKTLGHSRPIHPNIIQANQLRDVPLPLATSHLRTCYAGLMRQVPLHDLVYEGNLYRVCPDIALFWPALELAGTRAHFIPDILYAYQETEINDHKIRLPLVLTCYQDLRAHKRYAPLDDLQMHNLLSTERQPQAADLIIFSYNRPLQLYALLESVKKYITGLDLISVIYRVDEEYAPAYEEIKQLFPAVCFLEQSRTHPSVDFKNKVLSAFEMGSSKYIVFAVDDIIVKDTITIYECTEALEKTHAYGFYLRLGKNLTYCYNFKSSQPVPPLIEIQNDIVAWQFKYSNGDWAYPNTVDMTIYKKSDIKDALATMNYNNPSNLEAFWYSPSYVDMNKMGLCYKTSKIINIPLNVVQKDRPNPHMNITPEYLLDIFNQGLKIDLTPLDKLDNKSAHCEVDLLWCNR